MASTAESRSQDFFPIFNAGDCSKIQGWSSVFIGFLLRVAPKWCNSLYFPTPLPFGGPADLLVQAYSYAIISLGVGLILFPEHLGPKRASLVTWSLHLLCGLLWVAFGKDSSNTGESSWIVLLIFFIALMLFALHSNFEKGDMPWLVDLTAWATYEGLKEGWPIIATGAVLSLSGFFVLILPKFFFGVFFDTELDLFYDQEHFFLLLLAGIMFGIGVGGMMDAASKPSARIYFAVFSLWVFVVGLDMLAGRYAFVRRRPALADLIFGFLCWIAVMLPNRDLIRSELPAYRIAYTGSEANEYKGL